MESEYVKIYVEIGYNVCDETLSKINVEKQDFDKQPRYRCCVKFNMLS
jgi:hypothetical protein